MGKKKAGGGVYEWFSKNEFRSTGESKSNHHAKIILHNTLRPARAVVKL